MNIFSQNFELVSENVYSTYKIKSAQILNLKTVLGAKNYYLANLECLICINIVIFMFELKLFQMKNIKYHSSICRCQSKYSACSEQFNSI